jgi:hypothetical protein
VVTRVTLRTHALPSAFGFVAGTIRARTDPAFRELLERFLAFYRDRLNDEHWGEQVRMAADDTLAVTMVFQGLSAPEAEEVWRPLRAWVERRPDAFTTKLDVVALPAQEMWNRAYLVQHSQLPIVIRSDPGAAGLFWWAANQAEVGTYWYAYQSRWIPWARFAGAEVSRLAGALFEASRHWPVALHFNKGLAGAAPEAIARERETAMNPAVLDAAALVIASAHGPGFPGVPGHEPDAAAGEQARARVAAAMKPIRALTPEAGTYLNEADYFEPDWQRAFWGAQYPRLLAIKRRYDPSGMFTCHHCVGSEDTAR